MLQWLIIVTDIYIIVGFPTLFLVFFSIYEAFLDFHTNIFHSALIFYLTLTRC